MHVFFSIGEPSGDVHAAHLIRELQQRAAGVRCTGFGGPKMEQAGLESLYRLTDLAVMGIGDVLPKLGTFRGLVRRAEEHFRTDRPDACVLIDYPGFNWHIARAAKQAGVEVVYYLPPQLWAWGGWRLGKLKRTVDRVLTTMPFETRWYQEQSVPVEEVGHPFFDEIAMQQPDAAVIRSLQHSGRCVGLLPGSRNSEVRRNFPVMVDVVRRLRERHPDTRFAVACFKQEHADFCSTVLQSLEDGLPIDIHTGRTPEIIMAADCVLMVSGSVSLEVLARAKPAAVMYRTGALTGFLAWLLVRCPFVSLPNLMAGRLLMPEFPFVLRPKQHARRIAAVLDRWLAEPLELARAAREMRFLRDRVAQTGGIARAAAAILGTRAAGSFDKHSSRKAA